MEKRNKILKTLGIILLWVILSIPLLIPLFTPPPSHNFINFIPHNKIINKLDNPFLDTLFHVGMDELDIKNYKVYLLPFTNKFNIDEYEVEAYTIFYKNDTTFIIFLKDNPNINIISHELLHMKQYSDSLLRVDGEFITYNGILYNINELPYNKRPWEIDAFNEDKELEYKLKKLLFK